MVKLGLSKAQKKTIRFAGKDRKRQLLQYYEDSKGQELDELYYKKTQDRCDEKAPHEMEEELSALRTAKSPLANVEEEQTPTLSYSAYNQLDHDIEIGCAGE